MDDKMAGKIQALLNMANDSSLGEDAKANYLAKAKELMWQHKIDDIMLGLRSDTIDAERTRRRTVTDVKIEWVAAGDEFLQIHMDVASALATLCGVRIVFCGGWTQMQLHAIGYPDDIDFLRMLWSSTYLAFSAKLYPEWDTTKSDGHNIRQLAESGIKWLAIWEAARKAGTPMMRVRRGESVSTPVPAPPNDGGYMKREMGKAYAADGMEKPKLSHGVRNYRDSFAVGFERAVTGKVSEMLIAQRRRERETSDGVGLVLASDANAIRDYYDRMYPPGSTSSAKRKSIKAGYGVAADRGAAAGRSVDMTMGSRSTGAAASRKEIGG